MAIQLAPLLAAGGKFALSKLPLITAAGAALPSLRQGRPVDALMQGGLGYLTGSALGGPANRLVPRMAGGLQGALQKMAPGMATKLGANLLPAAAGVSALGLGAGAFGLGSAMNPAASPAVQSAQQGLGGAGQLGLGALGYQGPGAVNYGGSGLPPGLGQYGGISPYGSLTDVYGVPGMAQRADLLQTARTQRDVLRTLLPEIEAAAESRSKKELERQMAAAGIRQNIATRAAMQQAAQRAGLNAGLGALQQAGGALTSQYQYQ